MHEPDEPENIHDSIPLTDGALRALMKTRGWVLFLGVVAIIGAIVSAFMMLVAIGVLAKEGLIGVQLLVIFAVYLVIAAFLAVFWLRYSGALKKISSQDDNLDAALEEVLVRQRRLWALQALVLSVLVGLSIAGDIAWPFLTH
jgi:hypothetical protein